MQQALIGTAKGLIVYEFPEDDTPKLSRIHFAGFSANMVYVDERSGRWWVGLSHRHWGQKLHYSDDGGENWQETALPSFRGKLLPNGSPAKLRQIWSMAHAGGDRPDRLWVGTDPGGLFYSEDQGESFHLVTSLWDHPTRQTEGQWFGAGSDFPFIHSIVVDPRDSDHVYIAVSCAGVFETLDGGKSWQPRNKGLVAAYLPNPNVEVGHDPHLMLMSPANPDILWQQNHCGIYFTETGGKAWTNVSGAAGIPYYGFALAVDEADPSQAWVIPVESDEQRMAPNLRLEVFQTMDFGKTWTSDSLGLPEGKVFDIVLRQAFAKQKNLFVFGTTNGNVFYRNQRNVEWSALSTHLTKVNSVFLRSTN